MWRDNKSWRDKNQQIFTLFVENLPEETNWQGLRHAFGRYGGVVDVFVPSKRNRKGRRFGFVRFGRRIDVEKTIEKMNDFMLIGSRIRVSMAIFKPRQFYWRKARSGNFGDKFSGFKQNDIGDSDESNRDENLRGGGRYPKNQSKKKKK
ncbi:hypothetical protein GQ457_10G005350 [Hibiscus cannabinus]